LVNDLKTLKNMLLNTFARFDFEDLLRVIDSSPYVSKGTYLAYNYERDVVIGADPPILLKMLCPEELSFNGVKTVIYLLGTDKRVAKVSKILAPWQRRIVDYNFTWYLIIVNTNF